MIGRITGTLLEKNPPQILIDVHGIGYELEVPMSTFYNLPANGSALSLHTHQLVREDAQLLYGFASEEERRTFRQLIKVSGIGARIALALLSGMSVAELATTVREQQTGRLTKIPGIGKKTAERLLLELRDKLDSFAPAAGTAAAGAQISAAGDSHGDILNALLALGYKEREALAAMKGLDADVGVPEGIRLALRQLAPG